jgi:ketosteroid isomerase-like protein
MRRTSLLFALAWTFVGVVGCAARHSFTDADRHAVRQLLEQQRQAWNRGDLEGFMAAYERSDDLIFTSGARIRRGFATTLEKYRARYGDDQASMGRLEFAVLDIRGVGRGADVAVVLGTWRVSESAQAGHGVFSLVCVRTANGWRVIHDHTSADIGSSEPEKTDIPQRTGPRTDNEFN